MCRSYWCTSKYLHLPGGDAVQEPHWYHRTGKRLRKSRHILILPHNIIDMVQIMSIWHLYVYIYTRFPSANWLGEWRKNESKSIQRGTNTTTYAGNSGIRIVLVRTLIHKRALHFRTERYFLLVRLECTIRLGDKPFGVPFCSVFCAVLRRRGAGS